MNLTAASTSPAVSRLFWGAPRPGVGRGAHHIDFSGYVVSLTAPGGPRMPNGLESEAEAQVGLAVSIGSGLLKFGELSISPGPVWNPVPRVLVPCTRPEAPDGLLEQSGRGPGLTPAGDDLLMGYLAGLVLLHGETAEAERLASLAGPRTTSLSATLLAHAARGEVPEPVHDFLERGDSAPLLRFGHTSGTYWLAGLRKAGARPEDTPSRAK